MIDYHTHSIYSDGRNKYKDVLEIAIKKGLKEIGFSDHLCLNFPNWAVQKKDFSHIIDDINLLKQENSSTIKIKFGLEVDYFESKEDEISELVKNFPLDYVIGSVHYIADWNFDSTVIGYDKRDINKMYKQYFNLVQKAAKSGLFDIIGHIDLAKKFNYYPDYKLTEIYEDTAKILANENVVFELNTSGKDRPCKEFYPNDDFLGILYKYGVPVTLGSDSHKAKEVGRYFPEALTKLRQIGYNHIQSFTKRKRTRVSF